MLLDTNGYIIVKNVLSQEVLELVSAYAQFRASTHSKIRKGKDPLAYIHREYGDALMDMLLEKLRPQVEQATGLELWPTLSFYYTYKNGNQLLAHKDRNSCQIVAGLCIGADNEFIKSKGGWPLFIKHQGTSIPIVLDYGDMLVFKGHETEHWREPFTGDWFVSAIFGYVEKNGPFAFQKYDQRKMLGKPHVGMFNWLYGCVKNRISNKLKNHTSSD
ncbi:MAG: hypothetical protein ACHP65_00950 [Legionellales bacterium]